MFYTKVARIVAVIAVILGVLSLLLGLAVATGIVVEPEPGRYLGSKTSGQAIDRGVYYIVVGIILGSLAEIGRSLSKR